MASAAEANAWFSHNTLDSNATAQGREKFPVPWNVVATQPGQTSSTLRAYHFTQPISFARLLVTVAPTLRQVARRGVGDDRNIRGDRVLDQPQYRRDPRHRIIDAHRPPKGKAAELQSAGTVSRIDSNERQKPQRAVWQKTGPRCGSLKIPNFIVDQYPRSRKS
jgi:hypothetical protein